MDEKENVTFREAMERKKARLLEEAAAVDRDMAELARLAAKYDIALSAGGIRIDSPELGSPTLSVQHGAAPPKIVSDLIRAYKTVVASPYQKLKSASKKHYDTLLGLIETDVGQERLSSLQVDDFERWHKRWSEGGKVASGHSKIGMIRGLVGFGTQVLENDDCQRLFGILCKLKFEAPKPRNERLASSQAASIRAIARLLKRPSVALAQAFQTDVGLLQKDVIGEWAPVASTGVSDITSGDSKWMRGLRWNEIDDQLILRHSSDGWLGNVEFDLHKAPAVLEELRLQFEFDPLWSARSKLPLSGPIIVSEYDGQPWDAVEFRRWWRRIANQAGIPQSVRNTDSRVRAKAADGPREANEKTEGRIAQ
jgi:hypothetical protein